MATRRDPGSWRHSQAPDRQMLESDKYRRSMVPPSPASRARPSPGSAGCRGVPPRAGEDAGIRGSGCAFIYRHHTSCGRASLSPTSRPSGSRRCVVIRASPAPRQCGARSPGISTNIGAVARKTCSGSGADATRTGSTTSAGCGESGPERELPGGRCRSEDAHRGRPSRGRPSSSGPPAHPGGHEKGARVLRARGAVSGRTIRGWRRVRTSRWHDAASSALVSRSLAAGTIWTVGGPAGSRFPVASASSAQSCIARQTFSGVSGVSRCSTPKGRSASITALTTAGVEPMVAASPIPLTPSGLTWVGVTVRCSS